MPSDATWATKLVSAHGERIRRARLLRGDEAVVFSTLALHRGPGNASDIADRFSMFMCWPLVEGAVADGGVIFSANT